MKNETSPTADSHPSISTKGPHAGEEFFAAYEFMLDALIASEAEYENLEADAPVDVFCPECTLNTVPASLDTGLCAHHMRVAAIAKATGA